MGATADLTGTMRYLASPRADIAADFRPEQRRDVTIRKQILWESLDAPESKARAKEVELIREHLSNDPAIGYNRWPKLVPGHLHNNAPCGTEPQTADFVRTGGAG